MYAYVSCMLFHYTYTLVFFFRFYVANNGTMYRPGKRPRLWKSPIYILFCAWIIGEITCKISSGGYNSANCFAKIYALFLVETADASGNNKKLILLDAEYMSASRQIVEIAISFVAYRERERERESVLQI